MDFTPKQNDIIHHSFPHLVIDAAVGSGKTAVMVARIQNYITDSKVNPSTILAVSFTRKAAKNLTVKLADIPHGREVWSGTLHSWCAEVLRRWGFLVGYPQYLILDEDDSDTILKGVKDTGGGLNEYFKALRQYRAIDFAGLERLVLNLLNNRAEVKRWIHETWQHIFVDEAQDLSTTQWKIIAHLKDNPNSTSMLIGDSQQSIYSWRGVYVERFLREKGEHLTMTENFRSADGIIKRINRLNRAEPIVALSGIKDDNAVLSTVSIDRASTVDAVLCRTNRGVRKIERMFKERDVPFYRLGRKSFTEQTDVKLLINLWRITLDPDCELPYLIFDREMLSNTNIHTFTELITQTQKRLKGDTKGLGEFTRWLTTNNVSVQDSIHERRDVLDELLLSGGDDLEEPFGIAVGTVHAAKGLEWDSVFIYGFIEGNFPHSLSKRKKDNWYEMDEERRVAYVAITRARKRIYLHIGDGEQSRYLKEMS